MTEVMLEHPKGRCKDCKYFRPNYFNKNYGVCMKKSAPYKDEYVHTEAFMSCDLFEVK